MFKAFDLRKQLISPRTGPFVLLVAIVLLGLLLRLWNLDTKPLWLDEVLTALFSLGRRYSDVPLNQYFPLSSLDRLFTYRSGLSCPQIAQTVATESVHPPLFFCLMYYWMGWMQFIPDHWVWALRLLPALFGVGTIVAVYGLNRAAFSVKAGLMGAALMAVSPFAVYLSQEARHYTLPMLLITLALWSLVQMQHDLTHQQFRPIVWLSWTVINVLSLYVHYFCLLSLIGQVGALFIWLLWRRRPLSRYQWGALALALGGISLSYLPWLPTMLSHFSRPETDWLKPFNPSWLDRIAPLYQTLINWVLMVIALPVERQPRPVILLSALGMLGFGLWLTWQISRRVKRLWQDPVQQPAFLLLSGFAAVVVVECFAIVYGLNKDITVVPRYTFVYYPAFCALLGAVLVAPPVTASAAPVARRPLHLPLYFLYLRRPQTIVLLASLLSSLLVIQGVVFLKSYNPIEVADDMVLKRKTPMIVAVSYKSLQEVGLGLSFALEVRQHYPPKTLDQLVRFGFMPRPDGYRQFWRDLETRAHPLPLPLHFWVVASPGMRSDDYPDRMRIVNKRELDRPTPSICVLDPEEFHRIGFPYQLFRCRLPRDKS